MINHFDSSGSS